MDYNSIKKLKNSYNLKILQSYDFIIDYNQF